MVNSLATELREGFRLVVGSLSENERILVSRARDLVEASPLERSQALAEIFCCYRAGPTQIWGPVVLDLLAPAMLAMLQGFEPVPPVIDEEEIRQQLLLEVLRAAVCIPLRPAGRLTRFRVMSRARTGMLRWLAREGRRRALQVSFDELEEGQS